MDSARLDELEKRHQPAVDPSGPFARWNRCRADGAYWPCDARVLLDECRERGRIVSTRYADPIVIDASDFPRVPIEE